VAGLCRLTITTANPHTYTVEHSHQHHPRTTSFHQLIHTHTAVLERPLHLCSSLFLRKESPHSPTLPLPGRPRIELGTVPKIVRLANELITLYTTYMDYYNWSMSIHLKYLFATLSVYSASKKYGFRHLSTVYRVKLYFSSFRCNTSCTKYLLTVFLHCKYCCLASFFH
jgi:hypothetical protein